MIAVYIGRFQPKTITHRIIVQFIDKQPDIKEIIIIKGSSQWNDKNPDQNSIPFRNPFTAEECCDMIDLSLTCRITKPWRIIKIPDTATKMTDPLWKEWVDSIVSALGSPQEFVVFTNDSREIKAFKRVGLETRPYVVNCTLPHATLVREKIAQGREEEWRQMVDPEVAEYIKKINGPERIQKLLEKEVK